MLFDTGMATDNSNVVSHGIDLLATTVQLTEQGILPWEIGDRLRSKPLPSEKVTEESIRKANEINRFFRNKIMVRRLKNLHVSDYMKDLESLLENTSRVSVNKIPILVKLPTFYEESVETEKLIKTYRSLDTDRGLSETNEVWTFVNKIERNSKNQKAANFYFANSRNELLRITVPLKDIGLSVWDYIAKKGKIGIKASLPKSRIQGYDFYLYGLPNNYDLFDPR